MDPSVDYLIGSEAKTCVLVIEVRCVCRFLGVLLENEIGKLSDEKCKKRKWSESDKLVEEIWRLIFYLFTTPAFDINCYSHPYIASFF